MNKLTFDSYHLLKEPTHLYNVVYQSPEVSSVEEAKIIMIGECHLDEYRRLNAPIIDKLITPKSVLLVEGVPFKELKEERRDEYLRMLEISKFAQERISSVFGWDAFDSNNFPPNCSKDKEMRFVQNSFPERTAAMIRTLDTLSQKQIEGKIILIAGFAHLKECSGLDHPNYSLIALYEKLNTLPAVILSI